MTKVLLVEDDNNLREIYEARLLSEGYEVIAGKDGEDALSLIKQHQPELVISDVMMPRISGFEMLDILRNTGGIKQPKVIMLTALGQAEDRAHADGIGADLYLVKSQVTLEDIVKAAQDLTSTPAAEAAAAPAPEPQPVPEPQNIEIPEPSFSAASPVATEEPAPVIPEPTTEAPAAITNAEPAPQPAAPTTEASVAQQPESSPSAAQPAADLPQTNVDAEHEAIITDAAETLQAATPNAVSADATEDVPAAPSTSSKVIEPLSQNEEEKHINDLLAEEEAAAAIITPPEPQPQVQSQPQTYQAPTEPATPLATPAPVAAVAPPLSAAPEQPVAQPQVIGQPTAVAPPVAAPVTNPETPFAPSVGGSANTDAL